jgi:hypothetical protein
MIEQLIYSLIINHCLLIQAYFILDELIIAGEMQESNKKSILRVVNAQDQLEDREITERGWPENNRIGLRG